MEQQGGLLRNLPKIDELLFDERLVFLMEKTSRTAVTEAARGTIQKLREEILGGSRRELPDREALVEEICRRAEGDRVPSLKRVINGTGVILHTNLGRAVLGKEAAMAAYCAAVSYSNLEYDTEKGGRGSRHDHIEEIVKKITGAEAAMVVNNNAAATMLCLSALACQKEVVVSRGELVEIGGSFRIPDIMEQSGARLREVGTTNKTRISDYEAACGSSGFGGPGDGGSGGIGALMKVHTSNYRIVGFTQEASLLELSALGKKLGIPVIYDMGSGLLADLSRFGIDEPTVPDALKAGADVVLFSGDKLLGGPQGGIIIGKKEYISKMKRHPLARVVRVDKMTLAAMEAVFGEYLDMERAKRRIPVLQMITAAQGELNEKAKELKRCLKEQVPEGIFEVLGCEDPIGGGSAPTAKLPGAAVAVTLEGMGAERLERLMRKAKVPVIGRISHNRVLLSVRTIKAEEFPEIADALLEAQKRAGALRGDGDRSASEETYCQKVRKGE